MVTVVGTGTENVTDLENPRRGTRGNMEEGTNKRKMYEWNNTMYN
jgi:hypothetical protein